MPGSAWQVAADGLEIGRFQLLPSPIGIGDGKVTVVRIDPLQFEPKLYCADQNGHQPIRADEWADRYGLHVVVNAGMFDGDWVTHTGYMKTPQGVNAERVHPEYFSAFAFDVVDGGERVEIFDTDEVEIEAEVIAPFRSVVQNLRLIKRPGENRWSKQQKRWSECALGQDGEGRLLLIFCRTPYSMHELIEHLLNLPIDLRCAQHLEGGPEASLFLVLGEFRIRESGSYETGFNENDDLDGFIPIPNVIGFVRRSAE